MYLLRSGADMSKLLPPHGSSELKPLLLEGEALREETRKAQGFKKVPLTSRETSDLIMMGIGAFTPLEGFMGKDDWKSCATTTSCPAKTACSGPSRSRSRRTRSGEVHRQAKKWRSGTQRPKRSWAP